eukprot:COSAG03_NODE_23135_length_283_cov_0.554348_1_plen_23_part_01
MMSAERQRGRGVTPCTSTGRAPE